MLYQNNIHAKAFRMARDMLKNHNVKDLKLGLIFDRQTDGRVYNKPTIFEVVALIVGDIITSTKRDIIIQERGGNLQRIDEFRPSYLTFQYPLLFPYGEDGYKANILHAYEGEVVPKEEVQLRVPHVMKFNNMLIVDVSPSEACWRIFSFNICTRKPTDGCMFYHLIGEKPVSFTEHATMENVLEKESVIESMFMAWLIANEKYEEERTLKFGKFVTKFVYDKKTRCCKPRKKGYTIRQLIWVPSTTGELFYLRMMLTVIKGLTTYDDILKVGRTQYFSFRDACFAMGFHEDDKEIILAIKEASAWGSR
ncbi:hypothetical protein KIW84_075626 [Lathyrus oleraceus]|uniref:Uncharacterized protein n=1 Tax=Pisum sativum TaxID=3888 RepID=A0A9D4VVU6_PEA|nr:hypothetical protein KIW84_075626 [Pisum sativum]